MAVDSSVLYQEAKCFLCLGISQIEALSLALQVRWLLSLNPLADTTLNTLLSESNCLRCYTNVSMFNLLSIALLRKIQVATIVDSFVARAEITSDAQISALNGLVESALENGWWSKCDLIYPFVGGTALAHSQNLKSSNFTITWNGTVTHDANGITGDAATGFGATGYIPSSSGQISLNSCHFGVYRRTNGNAFDHMGATSTPPNAASRISGTNASFGAGLNTNGFVSTFTAQLGWLVANRSDAVNQHLFVGGSDLLSARASAQIPVVQLYVLARNANGVAGSFQDSNLASATVGSSLDFAEYLLMASDWQAFQTALGRQV